MFTYPVFPSKVTDIALKISINTALGSGTTFTLPLSSFVGLNYDFWWNPGDGSADRHVTAYNDANATYDYGIAFSGQVSIGVNSGDICEGWRFITGDRAKVVSIDAWGDLGFKYITDMFSYCANLSTIVNAPIFKNNPVGVTAFDRAFQGCSSLTSIPPTMLNNWSSLTTVNTLFSDNTALTSIHPDIFIDNINISGFSEVFRNSGLTSIPSGLFRNNTLANNFGNTFYRCQGLQGSAIPTDLFRYNINVSSFSGTFSDIRGSVTIPENLFYYNTGVSNYSLTFWNSRNFILPTVLFNLANLGIVTTFSEFMKTNSTSYSFTGTIQDVWNYATSASSVNAFLNQTALTNYASIPNGWKGL